MLLTQTCFLVYSSITFHLSPFLISQGQERTPLICDPFSCLQLWLKCCWSSWLALPLRIHPDRCISKQPSSKCGCFIHLPAGLRTCFAGLSCATSSKLCAESDFFFFFSRKCILSWNNHVFLWWLIMLKEKSAHMRVPRFLVKNSSIGTQACTPTQTRQAMKTGSD